MILYEQYNAMNAAERLRKLVEDTPIKVKDELITITISLGVAGKMVTRILNPLIP